MDSLVICAVALVVSGLTLFSGFGLGTLLMPAFALFFPVEAAIAATAVVHLANNVFKALLLYRYADWGVVARFSIPAAGGASLGALLLTALARLEPIATYSLEGIVHEITVVKATVGALVLLFALIELVPALQGLFRFGRRQLLVGGALSGFFGGLSGHQGALRSAVLLRSGLAKEPFIGTGVMCALAVDLSRITIYGGAGIALRLESVLGTEGERLLIAATVAAFAGSFVGSRLMKKVRMAAIRKIVGAMLILIGFSLGSGLI